MGIFFSVWLSAYTSVSQCSACNGWGPSPAIVVRKMGLLARFDAHTQQLEKVKFSHKRVIPQVPGERFFPWISRKTKRIKKIAICHLPFAICHSLGGIVTWPWSRGPSPGGNVTLLCLIGFLPGPWHGVSEL